MATPPTASGRRRFPWLIAVGIALLIPVACGAWLFASNDPKPYVEALDELDLPPDWVVAATDANPRLLFGPRAIRTFLVDADPVDVVPILKEAFADAGYGIYPLLDTPSRCIPSPDATAPIPGCSLNVLNEDCRSNGPDGPITCWVEGYRRVDDNPEHLEDLYASVSPRGSTLDYGPGHSPRYATDPNLGLLVITASMQYPRHYWSSPTPFPAGSAP